MIFGSRARESVGLTRLSDYYQAVCAFRMPAANKTKGNDQASCIDQIGGKSWGPLITDPWSPQDHTNPFNGRCRPQASMVTKKFAIFGLTSFNQSYRIIARAKWTSSNLVSSGTFLPDR
ncbi:hypothetical protein PAAG_06711 [Paracoccidioides lutzii Pb01]|uniref:Uncharacterized protein n=1 Tax=Paracoccidioides lutzii (strain ATCC MYA-826 / Pb01) TaxID=502779 RepID=C1H7H0_PARBA|nr:hypothetical protein PAAG_06711 [Paracoccidioides lutzii Pb01]EEH35664.2 hypothetical protein PAAG_06711 [Paracoccidioides lutzii Pb01]